MKNKKLKFGFILLSVLILIGTVFTFNLNTAKAADENLLEGKSSWAVFYGGQVGWGSANGTIESTSATSFVMDMTSIGEVGEWGAQAQLKATPLSLEPASEYTYKAIINSDKDRRIFVKVVKSLDSGDDDNGVVLLEKWVDLTAGNDYNLEEKFTPTAGMNKVNFYYGVGGNDASVANRIEVSNISLTQKTVDYKNLDYEDILPGTITTDQYKYFAITGITVSSSVISFSASESSKSFLHTVQT